MQDATLIPSASLRPPFKSAIGIIFVLSVLLLLLRIGFTWRRRLRKTYSRSKFIGFFHPYCSSGGGGERVLWFMICSLLRENDIGDNIKIVIYTGDSDSDEVVYIFINNTHSLSLVRYKCIHSTQTIYEGVEHNFKISFTAEEKGRIKFCKIRSRHLLEATNYPIMTMLFQALASLYVCIECMYTFVPDIYCDTIGAAFTYPIVRFICGCSVIAYVHYPMISSDMLQLVREKRPMYNNRSSISSNHTISYFKLIYYLFFSVIYGLVGRCADEVMVNSTWTRTHIENLWTERFIFLKILSLIGMINKLSIRTVYPPCNVSHLCKLAIGKRLRIILSVGQFRSEKDHLLQLHVFKILYEKNPEKYDNVLLVIAGSCRNLQDEALVRRLKMEVFESGIPESNVIFEVNVSYERLRSLYAYSAIGLHTMWNEHFGISVVEMMAAGLVTVAHNSGGPRDDIIDFSSEDSRTGYLATSPEEYANAIEDALRTLELNEQLEDSHIEVGVKYNRHDFKSDNIIAGIEDDNGTSFQRSSSLLCSIRSKIRERARNSIKKFSDEVFSSKIVSTFSRHCA